MDWLLEENRPFLYIEGFDGRVGMIVPPSFDFEGMGYRRVSGICGRIMVFPPDRTLRCAISITDIPNHFEVGDKFRSQPMIQRGNIAYLAYVEAEIFGRAIPLPKGIVDISLEEGDLGVGFQQALEQSCMFPPVLIRVAKLTRSVIEPSYRDKKRL